MHFYAMLSKVTFPILILLLVVGGYGTYSNHQADTKKLANLQEKIEKQTEKEEESNKSIDQLSQQLNILYTEKNGTANESLTSTTEELFSTVYNYRTDSEEDSVKVRKTKAAKYATETALNGLFPKDADKAVASISTISRMVDDPEIYLMPTNEKQLTALIVIHYAVSIAGSKEQTGTFMYKASFDPEAIKLTEVTNVGEVNIP